MSENFVDTFGFTDAAFNDDSEEDSNEMRRLTNVLSDEDATATASDAIKRAQGIFEAICDQRFTSFPGKFNSSYIFWEGHKISKKSPTLDLTDYNLNLSYFGS